MTDTDTDTARSRLPDLRTPDGDPDWEALAWLALSDPDSPQSRAWREVLAMTDDEAAAEDGPDVLVADIEDDTPWSAAEIAATDWLPPPPPRPADYEERRRRLDDALSRSRRRPTD